MRLISKAQTLVGKKFDFYLILFIGTINSFALMPSVTTSLGITSLEDGPVQPAVVFKNPEYFINDFHASEFQRLMWTTSTKWLPALLYKYLDIDPKLAHIFLTYSQTVVLLIGTFYLASSIFKSRMVSYISVAFVIMFAPYFNNFGLYGDQFFMPYGTWISIGPLLLAWSNSINRKRKNAFVWLFVGASIHPSMALVASVAILSFEDFSLKNLSQSIKRLLEIFLPAIFFSVIASMVRISSSADQIPAEWYSALKEVLHWYAWKLNPGNTGNAGATTGIDYFETTAYSILLIFAALILSQSSIFEFSERVKTSTIKLMLLFIILFILQAGSFLLNVSVLFSVSFGRISIFTSIFSVIIFASCITSIIQRKNPLKKIFLSPILTFCLLVPSFLNFAFLGLILILNELKLKKSNKIFNAICLVFITLSILFARANYNNAWVNGSILKFIPDALQIVPNYLSLKMLENLSVYSWLLIYAILVAYSLKIFKEYRKHVVITIIILSTFFTLGGRYILSERRDIKHSDWIETQLWALNNSQEKSRFIVNSGFDVYESWTTLSRRPRLIADLNAGFLYFYTKEDLVYDQKRSLLPTAPNPKNTSATDLEAFYLNFSREYTGDYLVWKKEFIKLSFDKVYENKQFIIYDIP